MTARLAGSAKPAASARRRAIPQSGPAKAVRDLIRKSVATCIRACLPMEFAAAHHLDLVSLDAARTDSVLLTAFPDCFGALFSPGGLSADESSAVAAGWAAQASWEFDVPTRPRRLCVVATMASVTSSEDVPVTASCPKRTVAPRVSAAG